jgi:hypothetical protein
LKVGARMGRGREKRRGARAESKRVPRSATWAG